MISSDPQAEGWPSLFEPDGKGPWAVRYNWIKHEKNEEFLANYFAEGTSELKLNLRNMTKDLAHLWKPHNDALARGEIKGDMVWRIKTLNESNRSIDHLEIWKSPKHIEDTFHTDYPEWTDDVKSELGNSVRSRGFIICPLLRPYPLISKSQALGLYRKYLVLASQNKGTRIESYLRYS